MEQSVVKTYNKWQWKTLAILMLGYAMYYFVRQNLAAAIPTLEAELGLTKAKLGLFLTCNQVIYGVAKLLSGILADRFSAKKLMAFGLFAAAVCNIAIGLTPQINGMFELLDTQGKVTVGGVYFIGAMWVLNGFFQSFGYPPCASLMSRWFKPSDLSTKQSIWNTSHNIGAGLVFLLVAIILKYFGASAWQWFFFAPAAFAIATSFLIYTGLRDNPSDVGLPSPESMDDKLAETGKKDKDSAPELVMSEDVKKKLVSRMSFGNVMVWLVALSDFFVYIIRLLIISWGATVLQQMKSMEASQSAGLMTIVEIVGGICGTLLAGIITDRYFKSKAHHTSLFCTILATVCLFFFWKSQTPWLSVSLLVMTSFFIYGPQALLGISASSQATKYAAGTANGLVGIVSYMSAVLAGWGFGKIVDMEGTLSLCGYSGWDLVFFLGVIFGICGSVCLALMWKAPATGYAKAEKIVKELQNKQ